MKLKIRHKITFTILFLLFLTGFIVTSACAQEKQDMYYYYRVYMTKAFITDFSNFPHGKRQWDGNSNIPEVIYWINFKDIKKPFREVGKQRSTHTTNPTWSTPSWRDSVMLAGNEELVINLADKDVLVHDEMGYINVSVDRLHEGRNIIVPKGQGTYHYSGGEAKKHDIKDVIHNITVVKERRSLLEPLSLLGLIGRNDDPFKVLAFVYSLKDDGSAIIFFINNSRRRICYYRGSYACVRKFKRLFAVHNSTYIPFELPQTLLTKEKFIDSLKKQTGFNWQHVEKKIKRRLDAMYKSYVKKHDKWGGGDRLDVAFYLLQKPLGKIIPSSNHKINAGNQHPGAEYEIRFPPIQIFFNGDRYVIGQQATYDKRGYLLEYTPNVIQPPNRYGPGTPDLQHYSAKPNKAIPHFFKDLVPWLDAKREDKKLARKIASRKSGYRIKLEKNISIYRDMYCRLRPPNRGWGDIEKHRRKVQSSNSLNNSSKDKKQLQNVSSNSKKNESYKSKEDKLYKNAIKDVENEVNLWSRKIKQEYTGKEYNQYMKKLTDWKKEQLSKHQKNYEYNLKLIKQAYDTNK